MFGDSASSSGTTYKIQTKKASDKDAHLGLEGEYDAIVCIVKLETKTITIYITMYQRDAY